jgi:hypothetical protein
VVVVVAAGAEVVAAAGDPLMQRWPPPPVRLPGANFQRDSYWRSVVNSCRNGVSHPALRNKARCISYMLQEDNIYNNRVYRDKCHNNQSIFYIAEVLQNKR